MIPVPYDLVAGDTESKLELTLRDSNTLIPLDLTGTTVYLKWKKGNVLTSVLATILSAAEGKIEYQFQAGELFAPRMLIDVEIIASSGKILTSVTRLELNVKEKL